MKASKGWADRDIILEDYGVVWWKWWSALQPPSRFEQARPSMLPPTYLMDWQSIRKPGTNGLILVIMSLRWWGVASTASSDWQKAVADVSSAIFCMADGIVQTNDQSAGKRKRGTKAVAGIAGKDTGEEKRVKKPMKKGWVEIVEIENDPFQTAPLSQAGKVGLRSSDTAQSSKRKADTAESLGPITRGKRTRAT